MEADNKKIIKNLKEYIIKLRQINETLLPSEEEISKDEQETTLLQKIVDIFDFILSNNFKIKEDCNLPKEKKNYYYLFISKHFNTPLNRFFLLNNVLNEINNNDSNHFSQKNWILFSILENTFSDYINEIYKQNLDKIYYGENSLMRKNKHDIKKILKNLGYVVFKNNNNADFDKYLEFLKDQSISSMSNHSPVYTDSQISGANPLSTFSEMSIIKRFEEKKKKEENMDSNYNFRIIKNFSDSLLNDFYTFVPEQKESPKKEKTLKSIKEENNGNDIGDEFVLKIENNENNDNIIVQNQEEEEESNSNSNSNSNMSNSDSEEDPNIKTGLVLNPVHYKYLPTDNLYQVKPKAPLKEYDTTDELIYNKQLTPMTNSHLLYLNSFYKKTLYHKFYKSNLNRNLISLKLQNYQCFICLKKFKLFMNRFPLESIYYCAYYMHFICKNCIASEYSIIPYYILANWSFDKFPISKKAKSILKKWYDKPVICFKREEDLIKNIPVMSQVVQIKIIMNYIFDKMKCDKKTEFIEDTLGEYKYLVLKEIIFSIRDLVEMDNKSFLKKINKFFNALVKHVSGECQDCFIEGKTCKCGSDEKLFLYDYKNVFYCPICDITYHRKCKGLLGYLCGHQ